MGTVEAGQSTAERIVAELDARHVKVTPQAFELWYEYLVGTDPSLKRAVNARLDGGALDDAAVSELHEFHLRGGQTQRLAERSSHAIMMEIDGVADLIRLTLGTSSKYGATLSSLLGDMVAVNDADALRQVITTLVHATEDARASNEMAETRLQAAHAEVEELRTVLETVRQETLQDPLTGVSNRKHFAQAMAQALESFQQSGTSFCLLMIDIDHFKQFNDQHGHLIGDKVLRVVAQALRERFRGRGVVARYGGEEFGVILHDADLMAGWVQAEGARQIINTRELVKRSTGEKLGRITVSIGVGLSHRHDTATSLIGRADGALLRAKQSGRNRTVTEDESLASDAA